MWEPCHSIDEPLLQEAILSRPRYDWKVRNLLCLLICSSFAMLLSPSFQLPYMYGRSRQQQMVPKPAISMSDAMLEAGDTVLSFGPHQGRTFADVEVNEPDYCNWALWQKSATSDLQTFVDYLKAKRESGPEQSSMSTMGDAEMSVGKHKGRTYADLKDNEPGYVSWVLGQQDPSSHLQPFIDYLKASGVSGGGEVPVTPGEEANSEQQPLGSMTGAMGDTQMTVGKHKGRTYADLKDNEPGYVSWVLGQQDPSGELQQFIEYLKAEGAGAGLPTPGEAGTQQSLPPIGDSVMNVGKHKGRTFADLKDNEPGYASWVLQQQDPSGDLQQFVEYLKAEGMSAALPGEASSVTQQTPLPMGDSQMNVGKHKGRTFADLKDNEPGYVSWAMGMQEPSGDLQAFIDYLKTEGVTPAPGEAGNAIRQAPLAAGDSVMPMGRYKGRTFADLKDNEPSYVSWALGQAEPSGDLQAFLDYLKAEGVTSPPPGQPPLGHVVPLPEPTSQMTIGKHKGRTFSDLKDNEPDYASWALQQQDPSGDLEPFVKYLKAEGVVPGATTGVGSNNPAQQPQAAFADSVMLVGKHKGRTFSDLKDNEPDYASWALKQESPSGSIQAFIDYLKAEGFIPEDPNRAPAYNVAPDQLTGDRVMTGGMHKGRTYADLKDHEPGYASWALGQAEPSGVLQPFVEYLKAQGVSASPRGSEGNDSGGQPQAPVGDSTMTVGRYKGRTFADLKDNESNYASWALKQANPSNVLQPFVEYLKTEGFSLTEGVTPAPAASAAQ